MSEIDNASLKIATDVRRVTKPRKRFLSEPQLTAILFIIPALIFFLLFVVLPIAQGARYSLYKWNGLGPLKNYVGLGNYQTVINDPVFWKSLGNNLNLVVWSLATQVPLAIFLAILLTGKIKGAGIFRTLFFVPFVLSDVLIGVMWQWIYNPSYGLANAFLSGIGAPRQGWLGDPNIAVYCIFVVSTWKYLGFHIVIYIAAIQNIPEELYEAARIDGASTFALHRDITVPLLLSTLRVDVVLIIIGSLKSFDLFWVLTGGSGGPSHSSELVGTYMFFQAFRATVWGYGSALAFALFLISFVFALMFLYMTRKNATVIQR
jgi:raffinose/stachyose/melibiose transport system permease protein